MSSVENFSKKEHLVKTRDFRKVYNTGRALRKGALVFYIAPNGLEANRIGFSIRSSTVKLATGRNRIKRLFREAYRKAKKGMRKGFDMVLVVKSDISKTLSFEESLRLLQGLIEKAGILIWEKQ